MRRIMAGSRENREEELVEEQNNSEHEGTKGS